MFGLFQDLRHLTAVVRMYICSIEFALEESRLLLHTVLSYACKTDITTQEVHPGHFGMTYLKAFT